MAAKKERRTVTLRQLQAQVDPRRAALERADRARRTIARLAKAKD